MYESFATLLVHLFSLSFAVGFINRNAFASALSLAIGPLI